MPMYDGSRWFYNGTLRCGDLVVDNMFHSSDTVPASSCQWLSRSMAIACSRFDLCKLWDEIRVCIFIDDGPRSGDLSMKCRRDLWLEQVSMRLLRT